MFDGRLLLILPAALVGVLAAVPVGCVPGLHIYNIMGLLALVLYRFMDTGNGLSPEIVIPFSVGMLTGYAVFNTIPAVLLAAPDESAMFTVLPGQKYLFKGRGLDAVMLTALGSAAALLLLPVALLLLAPAVLPTVAAVVRPHTHWVLWCVIVFMLMSEWPRTLPAGQAGLRRFLAAWHPLVVGLLTFGLSGLLGFILFYAPSPSPRTAFQNLMPAFVGLFSMPWLLLNLVSGCSPPPQLKRPVAPVSSRGTIRGVLAGVLGGGFAAFFPVVTGGVGGLLAGHAVSTRDSRDFLAAQGASKLVYYVGGFLLFLMPQLNLRRGGGAWLVGGLVTPYTDYEFLMALTAMAVAGAAALLLVMPLARFVLLLIARRGLRAISAAALLLMVLFTLALTGVAGLPVLAVAAGIGLLPVLYGARRMNCLGVILLPMACGMSGWGTLIAHWMHLT